MWCNWCWNMSKRWDSGGFIVLENTWILKYDEKVLTALFPGYRPVLVLQAGQGALELLLILVFQMCQQHVLSTGWVMVQGWAGVTQEVLIFIPESPTQETAHWATSTQPPAAQSRTKSMGEQTGQSKARQARQEGITGRDTMKPDRIQRLGAVCQVPSPNIKCAAIKLAHQTI